MTTISWGQLAFTGLSLLPYLAGLIAALATWTRHPRVSLLAALGCALALLAGVGGTAAQQAMMARGIEMHVFQLLSYAMALLRLVGVGLILAAVFVDRARPRPRRDEYDDEPRAVPRRGDDRVRPG